MEEKSTECGRGHKVVARKSLHIGLGIKEGDTFLKVEPERGDPLSLFTVNEPFRLWWTEAVDAAAGSDQTVARNRRASLSYTIGGITPADTGTFN